MRSRLATTYDQNGSSGYKYMSSSWAYLLGGLSGGLLDGLLGGLLGGLLVVYWVVYWVVY